MSIEFSEFPCKIVKEVNNKDISYVVKTFQTFSYLQMFKCLQGKKIRKEERKQEEKNI